MNQVPVELPPPVDPSPPESLKDILHKRSNPLPPVVPPPLMPTLKLAPTRYRQAIAWGMAAGLLFMLLVGTIFLIRAPR